MPDKEKKRSRLVTHSLLVLILVAACIVQLVWHASHATPIFTGHETPVVGLQEIREFWQNPVGHLRLILGELSPPYYSLYHVCAALVTAAVGLTYKSMVFTSTLFYLLLILSAYGIVLSISNEKGALAAAVAMALIPACFGWSRVYSPHIACMAVPALGVWLAARSDGFSRAPSTLLFGLLAVLSIRLGETVSDNFQNLLVFGSAGTYVFGVRIAARGEGTKRALALVGLTALLMLFSLDFSYVREALGYMTAEGLDMSATKYAAGNIFDDPAAILAYPALMWNLHLLWFFSVLSIIALFAVAWRPDRKEGLALAYLLVPLLVVTLISKKNYNYVFAFLPACPVLIGTAVGRIRRPLIAYAAIGLVFLAGCISYFNLSFRYAPDMTEPSKKEVLRAYERFFQTGRESIYLPAAKTYEPDQIARETVRLAESREGAALLILAEYFKSDAGIFRFLVELANADGSLTVIDPIRDIERKLLYGESRPVPPEPFSPDRIVSFMLSDQGEPGGSTPDAETILSLLHTNKILMQRNHPEQVLENLAIQWADSLKTIPWEKYASRRATFYSQSIGRITSLALFLIKEGQGPAGSADPTGP